LFQSSFTEITGKQCYNNIVKYKIKCPQLSKPKANSDKGEITVQYSFIITIEQKNGWENPTDYPRSYDPIIRFFHV